MGVLASAYSWVGRKFGLTTDDYFRWYAGSNGARAVNAQTAMQLSAVWSCVRLLSETVATLPLSLYERDEKGGKQVARGNPLYTLLHDQPHANLSAVEYWETVVAHVALWGNHYSRIVRVRGRVVSLEPLNPDRMAEPRVNEAGELIYCYLGSRGEEILTEAEVFHVKGFGVTGTSGLSVVGMARQSMSLAMATEEAASKVFQNGMQPSGFIEAPMVLKTEQRKQFRESLEEFTGSANTGKTLLLEAGMKYSPLSMNPEDAQMLETRAFNIEEICRWFRVPPWMIGHTENSTSWGTGLEQQMIAFLTFALRPYLTRIEQAVKRSLLSPAERLSLFAEFNLEGLLRADSQGRAALYSQMAQNGVYTRNEIRARENLPPIEGGDVLTVQSNLVSLDQLGVPTNANESGGAENP
jgi:HK97 family phage portal protein